MKIESSSSLHVCENNVMPGAVCTTALGMHSIVCFVHPAVCTTAFSAGLSCKRGMLVNQNDIEQGFPYSSWEETSIVRQRSFCLQCQRYLDLLDYIEVWQLSSCLTGNQNKRFFDTYKQFHRSHRNYLKGMDFLVSCGESINF